MWQIHLSTTSSVSASQSCLQNKSTGTNLWRRVATYNGCCFFLHLKKMAVSTPFEWQQVITTTNEIIMILYYNLFVYTEIFMWIEFVYSFSGSHIHIDHRIMLHLVKLRNIVYSLFFFGILSSPATAHLWCSSSIMNNEGLFWHWTIKTGKCF